MSLGLASNTQVTIPFVLSLVHLVHIIQLARESILDHLHGVFLSGIGHLGGGAVELLGGIPVSELVGPLERTNHGSEGVDSAVSSAMHISALFVEIVGSASDVDRVRLTVGDEGVQSLDLGRVQDSERHSGVKVPHVVLVHEGIGHPVHSGYGHLRVFRPLFPQTLVI